MWTRPESIDIGSLAHVSEAMKSLDILGYILLNPSSTRVMGWQTSNIQIRASAKNFGISVADRFHFLGKKLLNLLRGSANVADWFHFPREVDPGERRVVL